MIEEIEKIVLQPENAINYLQKRLRHLSHDQCLQLIQSTFEALKLENNKKRYFTRRRTDIIYGILLFLLSSSETIIYSEDTSGIIESIAQILYHKSFDQLGPRYSQYVIHIAKEIAEMFIYFATGEHIRV